MIGMSCVLCHAVFEDGEVFVLLWRMLPEAHTALRSSEIKQILEACQQVLLDSQVKFVAKSIVSSQAD